MLWEVEIRPVEGEVDREAARVSHEIRALGATSIRDVQSARSFLIEGDLPREAIDRGARGLLVDPVVETCCILERGGSEAAKAKNGSLALVNILYKPGVTDNVAMSAKSALADLGINAQGVATCRKYWFNRDA